MGEAAGGIPRAIWLVMADRTGEEEARAARMDGWETEEGSAGRAI